MILYEYPCNERVRSLLRVEHLFERLFFFAKGSDAHHHQISIATLFDLLDICDRTDLRGAVLDPATGKRRPKVRFFACREDISHESMEKPLPEAVINGREPFLIVGAISGG